MLAQHQVDRRGNAAFEQREMALVENAPVGANALTGVIEHFHRTLDPDVIRCHLVHKGLRKGIFYVNTRHQTCLSVGHLNGISLAVIQGSTGQIRSP